ncbi:Fe2+-dependent dioxygenase [Methylobacillus flagellatus]|uniref:PKHD-type hydroxylase Mfla_0096 n=1 Tax=Methylobacillus flagellatus (strain ATCC 51484 / DSM 6875 / VKM B-1610 / KT) TaxID=265072 RepID=Y096_METFK|nr:RecName: Full=PKHD-type hydroxylase Mfla_0096 [Methylobacillus flagellatus KT]ABE48367.1 Prolyl 4-hydroxylase, alpha subunit [Methylobacillus flagellatus KT]
MLITIPEVFTPEEAESIRQRLDATEWLDGKVTAGYQSAKAKNNLQLAENHPLAIELGDLIVSRLTQHPLFMSAALPRKVFPPLFNRYESGQSFGFHIDNAVRSLSGSRERVRTDLSSTLFFTPPEDYDGGELIRHASNQIARGTYGAVSRHQPAQGHAGDPGGTHLIFLLDPEPDP